MANTMEVKVPDIGDFKDVPVVEIMVSPGARIEKEDPLISLESDKATIEVPAPASGTVKSIELKVGDKVSQGALVLMLETDDAAAAPAPPAAPCSTAAGTTRVHPSPPTPPGTIRSSPADWPTGRHFSQSADRCPFPAVPTPRTFFETARHCPTQ